MRSSAIMIVSVLVVIETTWAQDAEDTPVAETPPALAAPTANDNAASKPASSDANHALSRATSARVVSGLPRYSPPKANGEENDASTDSPETDKPRNAIIRLPRYHVREPKLPQFKDRELLTPEGKLDLAFKRRPGLKIGNLFGLNRGIAMAMLAEDEAYERRLEMAELSSFTSWMDTNFPVDPQTGRRTEINASGKTSSTATSTPPPQPAEARHP